MDNGFDSTCPSGNTMIDAYHDLRSGSTCCRRCDGTGRHEWLDMDEFVETLDHATYALKKRSLEPKTFKQLMRLARLIKQEGQLCHACDGSGEVES